MAAIALPQEMVAVIELTVKKYSNVGYNKAALAFIEAKGNNIKNPRSQGGGCGDRYFCR